MGLLEVGSMLEGLEPVGNVELVYTCDDCERRTGDPYSSLASVVLTRSNEVVGDDPAAQGWTFFWDEPGKPCSRSYCRDCSQRRGRIEAAEGGAR